MDSTLDPVATGHKLCNIASNLRGQAALSRERCERDIFSCLLDGLADELTDIAAPMFDHRLKFISDDSGPVAEYAASAKATKAAVTEPEKPKPVAKVMADMLAALK